MLTKKVTFVLLASIIVLLCIFYNIILWPPASSVVEVSRESNVFIAALLHDNEKILDHWSDEILKTIEMLSLSSSSFRVFVSIVENSDSIDGTNNELNKFKRVLRDANIPHSLVTEKHIQRNGRDRVSWLSELRNIALEPLSSLPSLTNWESQHTTIIFLNDVYFHHQDVLKLVDTNGGNFDMACGLDFYYQFYDVWVSRDIHGNTLLGQYPFFRDTESRARVAAGLPVRVFSCWNGLSVIRGGSELFMARGGKTVVVVMEVEGVCK